MNITFLLSQEQEQIPGRHLCPYVLKRWMGQEKPYVTKSALKGKNSFYLSVTMFLLLSPSSGLHLNAAPTPSNHTFLYGMLTLVEFDKDVCSSYEPGTSLFFTLSCSDFFLGKYQCPQQNYKSGQTDFR